MAASNGHKLLEVDTDDETKRKMCESDLTDKLTASLVSSVTAKLK